ncbi:MAG: hypothetical protein IPO21_20740 [Bacteroidales bacterium]|nr:hypothetical protein [Bacteroidales bacterium]
MKLIIFLSVTIVLIQSAFAQTEDYNEKNRIQLYSDPISVEAFDKELLKDAILFELNNEIILIDKDSYEVISTLSSAAQDFAKYMSENDITKPEQATGNISLTNRLVKYNGANNQAFEFTAKATIQKGKDTITYIQIAKEVVFNWFNSKIADDIKSLKYRFIGIGIETSIDNKKCFIDAIIGNYSTLNNGTHRIATFPFKINITNMKLIAYDEKICKKCDKYPNIQDLQANLKVDENNDIWFETDQWKTVGKLFKLPTDALGVDIVLWEQYPCIGENVVDNNIFSKGITTKPVYQKKFIKLNQFQGNEAKSKFKIKLGIIPENVKNYELNLIIIQDKHFCKNIRSAYLKTGEVDTKSKCSIIGDTLSFFNKFTYQPKPDTAHFSFKIPFELGKSNYNQDDLKPFIEALNEPAFNPINIKISAYSSIEGEEETNEKLRNNRAESIISSLSTLNQSDSIATEVLTADTWELFLEDIKGTEFEKFSTLDKEAIRKEINKPANIKKLEPIFEKHRYAEVEMLAVYDLSDPKNEEIFVLKKFQEALDTGNLSKSLSIQKFMIANVRQNKYSMSCIEKMQIPRDSAKFAGMQMNKLWLEYTHTKTKIDSAFWKEVKRLDTLDIDNDYIKYNKIYADISLSEFTTEQEIDKIQLEIDKLLTKTLNKQLLDALNLELQLKALRSINQELKTNDNTKFIQSKLAKIKEIVNFNNKDSKEALNLAYLFINMGDYNYALDLLTPIMRSRNLSEELIFTYLSLCSYSEYMHQTEFYNEILEKAIKINKIEVCNLFKEGKLSYQLFENPKVKKLYCTECETQ